MILISAFDQAVRLAPNDAAALYGRGKAKQLKGDIAGGSAGTARWNDRSGSAVENCIAAGGRPGFSSPASAPRRMKRYFQAKGPEIYSPAIWRNGRRSRTDG